MTWIFWGGVVFFIGSIFLFVRSYHNLDVERNGAIVKMKIEKLPESCLGTKIKHFVRLSYNGEVFSKRVGGNFCEEHSIGQLIDVKYLESSSIVLWPNERVISDLMAIVGIGLLGVIISLSQWKKVRK
jgi:hypothetical protein